MTDLNAVVMRRRGSSLIPSDQRAEEFLEKVKDGKEVVVTIRKSRNPQHHKWVFAVLATVVKATGKWHSTDHLLEDLKMVTGLREVRYNQFTGKPQYVVKSVSFEAMDDFAFRAWFDIALPLLAEAVGCDPVQLLEESKVDYRPKDQADRRRETAPA